MATASQASIPRTRRRYLSRCRCWLTQPDLCLRWPSRLVVAAAEGRLSFRTTRRSRPPLPNKSAFCKRGLSQCPLRSESDRSAALPRSVAMCHKRTYAVQQIVRLFDYLVGELLELQWHFEPERLSGFHVDAQHKLGRELDRQFGRFCAFQNLVDEVGRRRWFSRLSIP